MVIWDDVIAKRHMTSNCPRMLMWYPWEKGGSATMQ